MADFYYKNIYTQELQDIYSETGEATLVLNEWRAKACHALLSKLSNAYVYNSAEANLVKKSFFIGHGLLLTAYVSIFHGNLLNLVPFVNEARPRISFSPAEEHKSIKITFSTKKPD